MPGLNELAKRANISVRDAKNLFQAILGQLAEDNTEYVTISNFGSFRIRRIPGRTVTSPVIQGGAPVTFPDQLSIMFKPAPAAKRKLANMAQYRKGQATHAKKVLDNPPKRKVVSAAPAKKGR